MSGILPIDDENTTPHVPDIDNINRMLFDLSPDNSQGKIVYTIYGHKGAGKTENAFFITTGRIGGYPAGLKTVAISFDNKTKTTRDQWFPHDKITVHNGKKYYSKNPAIRTRSGYTSYIYLLKLFENEKPNNPDWVVIDGFTELAEILEMSMRYINGLRSTQGFKNKNFWKDRGSMIQDIHDKAMSIARLGVIYTTYSDKNEIIQDGETVTKEDVPKYVDVVMRETDVVLKASKQKGKSGNVFYLTVESTKFKQYLGVDGKNMPVIEGVTLSEGRILDVTGLAEKIPTSQSRSDDTPVKVPLQSPPVIAPDLVEQEKTLFNNTPDQDVKNVPAPTPIIPKQEAKPEFRIPNLLSI